MTAPPQIPFSREAEEAVLGSLLINPDVYRGHRRHPQAQ